MSLTEAQNLFLKSNLLGVKDGIYTPKTSDNVTVEVKDGIIKCKGTTSADTSVTITVPIEKKTIRGKYNFSIQNIKNNLLAFPTVFLDGTIDKYQHITHVYGASSLSYITFETTDKDTLEIADATVSELKLSFAEDKSFDVEFNLMLQEGEIRGAYTPYGEMVDKSQILAEYSNDVVRPRMFGAVGDGVIDDTAALQAAINYALENSKKMILDSGCTYLISKTLNFNGSNLWFDGQGATIKMNDNIPIISDSDGIYKILNVININTTSDIVYDVPKENGISLYNKSTYINRVFGNVKIDCNVGVARTGLYIEKGGKTHFSNIMICDPATYGVQMLSGNEAVFDNLHFTRSRVKDRVADGENTVNLNRESVGLRISTSDTYIHDCVAIDFKTGFFNGGSDNHYARCHVWNAYTQSIIKDSIGFDVYGGYATFSQCIIDSERYGWVLRGNAKAFLTNCCNAYNQLYIDNKEEYGEPILFYFDKSESNEHIQKGEGLVISSSCFKAVDGLTCHFDNLENDESYIIIDKLLSNTFTDVHVSEAIRTNNTESANQITNFNN